MPKRKPVGQQVPTLPAAGDLFQASFDLIKMDQFPTGLGVQLIHFKAIPSPIGLKDRGDLRRPDTIDTISSNGMIYKKSGCFTATFVSNNESSRWGEGGMLDDSTARLILPRFYDTSTGVANGDRIYPAVGDRLYIADQDADVLVPMYQRMEYQVDKPDQPQFPVCKVEFLTDSRGIDYIQNVDFKIDVAGNIEWLAGGQRPGIDPETGKGRVYAIRYLYRAYWYVSMIPNEIRITNVTQNGVRTPERLPYHLMIQREFVYHNINNSTKPITMTQNQTNRVVQGPSQSITSDGSVQVNSVEGGIQVNMANIDGE